MVGTALCQAAHQQEQMSNLHPSPFNILGYIKDHAQNPVHLFYKVLSSAAKINEILVDHIKKGLSLEPDPEFTEKPVVAFGQSSNCKLNYSKKTNSR